MKNFQDKVDSGGAIEVSPNDTDVAMTREEAIKRLDSDSKKRELNKTFNKVTDGHQK